MQPVLGHQSIVLYNWRRLDPNRGVCMENMATLNNFFDGRDESWFYLITAEIEAEGIGAILPMMLAMDAILRFREQGTGRPGSATSGEGDSAAGTSPRRQPHLIL